MLKASTTQQRVERREVRRTRHPLQHAPELLGWLRQFPRAQIEPAASALDARDLLTVLAVHAAELVAHAEVAAVVAQAEEREPYLHFFQQVQLAVVLERV